MSRLVGSNPTLSAKNNSAMEWRSGRVVEGGRLESVWAATSRGFESLLLRQKLQGPVSGALVFVKPSPREKRVPWAWKATWACRRAAQNRR